MSEKERRWLSEEGTKDIPLDPAALKQHQPPAERQEGERGAGGARAGGDK